MSHELRLGKTVKGVGWISQLRIMPEGATDPVWMSWTQWKDPDVAARHARKLLERPDGIAARIVRVDWTAIELIEKDESGSPPAAGLDTTTG